MNALLSSFWRSDWSVSSWLHYFGVVLLLAVFAETVHRQGGARIALRWRSTLWWIVALRILLLPGFRGVRTMVPQAALDPVAAGRLSPVTWVLAVWALGCLVFLLRAFVHRKPVGRRVTAEEFVEFDGLFERLRCLSPPSLWISSDSRLGSPAVAGPSLRPQLWIPESWLVQDRRSDLLRALAHELSHIERRDLIRVRLLEFWRALFWFHPAAHLVVSRLEELREVECDRRAALRLNETPQRYGCWLAELALERSETPMGLALGGRSGALVRRVESVMRSPSLAPAGRLRRICEGLVIAVFLGLILPPRIARAAKIEALGERPPGCLELRYRVLAELAEVPEAGSLNLDSAPSFVANSSKATSPDDSQ